MSLMALLRHNRIRTAAGGGQLRAPAADVEKHERPWTSVPVPKVSDHPVGLSRVRLGLHRRVVGPAAERVACAVRLRRNRAREFRPVFVAGAIGSGTSLTAVLLGQTFACAALINESARQISKRSPLYVDRTDRHGSVQRYRDAIAPGAGWTPELVRRELLQLYRSHADGEGEVVIDKGPNTNMTRADLLADAFPSGRFVFVFRDPVSNVEGFRRKWAIFRNEPLARSIEFYRDVHEAFLDWAEARGVELLAVEYERLVEVPEAVLGLLGEALSLREATRTRKLEDKGNAPGERGIRNVSGSRVGVVKEATKKSYENMNAADVEVIRRELGPLHERMQRTAARLHDRVGG